MTTVIDLPQALDLLRQARNERGSLYRYSDDFDACAYAGTPRDSEEPAAACLIGVALNRAGVPVEAMLELSGTINRLAGFMYVNNEDGEEADDPAPGDLDAYVQGEFFETYDSELLGSVDVDLTEKATRVWLAAQRQQDTGNTWGEALAFAEQVPPGWSRLR
jgi:hypothetical protein